MIILLFFMDFLNEGDVADPFSSGRDALETSSSLDDCGQAHGAFS